MPDRSQNTPTTHPPAKTLRNDACPQCERLLDELNVSFHSVHDFILRNHEERTEDNDGYLGELGRLIHAQVVARRTLIHHQQKHS
jgi:hypothetical protein